MLSRVVAFALAAFLCLCMKQARADSVRQEVWLINGVPTVVTITRHDGPAPVAPACPDGRCGLPVPAPVPVISQPALLPILSPAPSSCPNGRCPLQR